MRKLLWEVLVILLFLLVKNVSAQLGEWTWLKGDSSFLNSYRNVKYGIKGIPDSTVTPGSSCCFQSWRDDSASLWLYGGAYYFPFSNAWLAVPNLWKYDIITNQWTWIKGSGSYPDYEEYGTQGMPDSLNTPAERMFAAVWYGRDKALWMYGGYDSDNGRTIGFSDFWKFDVLLKDWIWEGGGFGVIHYGIKGIADTANHPPGRGHAESWTDKNGNLWMFGGMGINTEDFNTAYFNDLWKYDPVNSTWTWISGDSIPNQCGSYGLLDVPDSANIPGARSCNQLHWIDTLGNLYLFGGFHDPPGCGQGWYNDLWKYNIKSGLWTWIDGKNYLNDEGIFNSKCSVFGDKPSARYNASGWTTPDGVFWFFGGDGILPGGSSYSPS